MKIGDFHLLQILWIRIFTVPILKNGKSVYKSYFNNTTPQEILPQPIIQRYIISEEHVLKTSIQVFVMGTEATILEKRYFLYLCMKCDP